MVTTVGLERSLENLLWDLVLLDLDAAEAYESAIKRLANEDYRAKLEEFREDHLRHAREVGAVLNEMGHPPPGAGDIKQIVTKGKVVIGSMLGDRGILEAMRSNEDDTVTAYDRAVAFDAPPAIHGLFKRNQADEHRHRAWIVGTLARR